MNGFWSEAYHRCLAELGSTITPTFSAGGVDLYLGDSAVIVPTLTIDADLLATDPPYGVAYQSNFRSNGFDVMLGDKGEVDVPDIIRKCLTKLKSHRHVYVFGPERLLYGVEKLISPSTLIWDKGNIGMGDLSLPRGPSHEPISFSVYVPSKANRESGKGSLGARLRQGSILRGDRPNSGAVRHPSEKPVAVMRQIIESSSCLGDLVLDPFMGSGSTIIAALLEGRRAIGIEADPKYFEIAKSRVVALLPLLEKLSST